MGRSLVDSVPPCSSVSGNPSILQTVAPVTAGNVQQPDPQTFKPPPGFKELRDRVTKFSGDEKEDFKVWLTGYCEATGDCGWSDQIATWFSWSLVGAAKLTWQKTLNGEGKGTWASIMQSYKGHCGVHMDPRTAYLHCHEMQHSDFPSVQELLKSNKGLPMDQLSNDNLISILWNRVPYKL